MGSFHLLLFAYIKVFGPGIGKALATRSSQPGRLPPLAGLSGEHEQQEFICWHLGIKPSSLSFHVYQARWRRLQEAPFTGQP